MRFLISIACIVAFLGTDGIYAAERNAPKYRYRVSREIPAATAPVTLPDAALPKVSKTRKTPNVPQSIARSVFFSGKVFDQESLVAVLSQDYYSQLSQASGVTFSFIFTKDQKSVWVILYGKRENVEELHAVFSDIAAQGEKLSQAELKKGELYLHPPKKN